MDSKLNEKLADRFASYSIIIIVFVGVLLMLLLPALIALIFPEIANSIIKTPANKFNIYNLLFIFLPTIVVTTLSTRFAFIQAYKKYKISVEDSKKVFTKYTILFILLIVLAVLRNVVNNGSKFDLIINFTYFIALLIYIKNLLNKLTQSSYSA